MSEVINNQGVIDYLNNQAIRYWNKAKRARDPKNKKHYKYERMLLLRTVGVLKEDNNKRDRVTK